MSIESKTPKRRFKEFKKIDGWEVYKLGDMLKFSNGFNGNAELYGRGMPYISVMDILNNNFISYDVIRGKVDIDEQTAKRYAVNFGDVLFQRSSENIEDSGKSNVYIEKEKPAVFGGFVIRGKKVGEYNPYFMKYLLDTAYTRKQIMNKAQGAQHINIGQDTLKSVEINMPHIDEQNKIGKFINNLDRLITINQRKLEKLKALKKAYLTQMFPAKGESKPKLRFAGFNDEWEKRKLGDITNSFSGGTPSVGNKAYYDGKIPFIRSGEINRNITELFISKDGLNNSSAKLVKKGYILYALYGATSGEVAISKISGAINQAILAIEPLKGYNASLLMYWLRKEKTNIINTYLQGGQGNLSGNIVKELLISIPKKKIEQEKVGKFLSKLDNLITLHQRKLEKLQNLKKAYLNEMFI